MIPPLNVRTKIVPDYWDDLFSHTVLSAAVAKLLQSCPTLCDPIDGSPPGSSVPGILQARILEWVAISFSNACMHAKSLQSCPTLCDSMDSNLPGSSVHRILQARVLEGVAISFSRLVVQLCPTLCDSIDSSPSGSCVHGIFQTRILEWVAIPFSRGSFWPRDRTQVSYIAGRFFNIWATKKAQ